MAGKIIVDEFKIDETIKSLQGFQLTGAVMNVTTEKAYTLEPETGMESMWLLWILV